MLCNVPYTVRWVFVDDEHANATLEPHLLSLVAKTSNLPLTSTLVPTFVERIFGHADVRPVESST